MNKAQRLWEIESAGGYPAWWSILDYENELKLSESQCFELENPDAFILYRTILDEVWIMSCAVREKGKGHGKLLFQNFLSELRKSRLCRIGLEVSQNNVAAISLYQSVGFKEIARRPKYYKDSSDALLMQLDLTG